MCSEHILTVLGAGEMAQGQEGVILYARNEAELSAQHPFLMAFKPL